MSGRGWAQNSWANANQTARNHRISASGVQYARKPALSSLALFFWATILVVFFLFFWPGVSLINQQGLPREGGGGVREFSRPMEITFSQRLSPAMAASKLMRSKLSARWRQYSADRPDSLDTASLDGEGTHGSTGFGKCPDAVTPYSLDCHILQSKRADPYTLARKRDAGLLPDPRIEDCSDLPIPLARHVLNNIALPAGAPNQPDPPPREGLRVMCMILTYSKKHDNNLQSVRATWGRRCHGFVAFSNLTDPEIPSIHTPVYGGERYQNTWQKMRALWKYTWYHYGNEFDWFLKADDDTYIVWENFMEMLESPEVQAERARGKGVLLGRRFAMRGNKLDNYTSGGAGYVLDRTALGKLASELDTKECDPTGQHQFEDYYAGKCLRNAGVAPMDTRDSKQRERFNPFQPWNTYQYQGGDWYEQYSLDPIAKGIECCSRKTLSFHYQPRREMYQTHRYLYNCRGNATTDL